jgi:hypothetical protein
MAQDQDTPLDRLWQEYGDSLKNFDDLTLARWMAQTLGQFEGQVWRFSHPLVGVYRIAAGLAHDRQIWFKRLVTTPRAYLEAPCCRAPLLPFVTRDFLEMGLICQHCAGTGVPLDEVPAEVQFKLKDWAKKYNAIHDVAHWDDEKKRRVPDFQKIFEEAAQEAETLLARSGRDLCAELLDHYPAVIWEDQDECLDVRPEDIQTWKG